MRCNRIILNSETIIKHSPTASRISKVRQTSDSKHSRDPSGQKFLSKNKWLLRQSDAKIDANPKPCDPAVQSIALSVNIDPKVLQ